MKSKALIALGVLSTTSLIAHAGGATSWLSAANGDWNVGANWDSGVVPGLSDSVLLGHASAYTVTMPASQTMASLMITNPGVVLNTGNATTQSIAGDFLNNGMVVVNFTSNISITSLQFNADTMLTGSGSILLNAPALRARILTGTGFTFTQGSGHTIRGQGRIEGAMINDGTVSSDLGLTMTLQIFDKTNNSIMQAINGSNLAIAGITVPQGLAGVIRADGVGSRVTITGSTIMGGAIGSINDADISISGTSAINGVSVSGEIDVQNAATLSVAGSLDNSGTITINPTGNVSATQIVFNDSMTVSGNGTFILASPNARARIQTGVGQTVTMNPMLTILGQGRIEASMVNNGLIRSDTAEIRMITNDKTNNGTMEAIGGSVMELSGITITQGGAGLISADGVGSQIELIGSTVDGGTLQSINGADVTIDSSSTLNSVNFTGDLNIQNAQTLTVNNALTSNGTITINPTGNISSTQILFNDTMTLGGTGEIVLASPDSRARVQTSVGSVLTLPATQTIRGLGRIEADMINNGIIRSDTGNEIRLVTNSKVNNSTIEAVNASNIEVSSITIDQTGGGVLSANDAGSQIELLSATIEGGIISAAIGADISIDVSSMLDGVTIIGNVNVQNSRTLTIGTSLTNAGVIEVNPTGNISTTQILFNDSMTVDGVGSIKLSSPGARARIQTAVDKTVTMSSTQTIHGQGQIEASMINNGMITSDVLGGEIRFTLNGKTNNGVIQANNDSNLEFSAVVLTQGAVGQILADGAGSEIELASATISGGSLTTTNGADVSVNSLSALDGVNFSGLLNIPNASTLGIAFGTLNNGLIVVNETSNISTTQLRWNEEMILGGSGTIRLNAPGARARLIAGPGVTQGGIGSQQRLEGIGRIDLNLINDGTIAPGLSIGTMTATQPILFTGIASFEAEVDAAFGDLLDSSSTIELHGTLDVLYINGFAPTGFWARTIIEGSNITGSFDVVNVPAAPFGLVTKVLNTGTEIIVGQTCPADQNIDGVLNFFDVSRFLADFAAMDPSADFTGDGEFNFFDISAFLGSFSGGCS